MPRHCRNNTGLLWAICNDLDIGKIGGLPRIKVALALSKAFGCGINDLPLSLVLSWYEQKAVRILLTPLCLGIKNILLGPSLPAFVSPPEQDLAKILGK
ncbi:hypothetical protein FACS1894206_10100 [Deltaproteobacteria bacterium]|nr:hypothetical protein FACS1894206_10100 [Deltaproteobacteria bacterium]